MLKPWLSDGFLVSASLAASIELIGLRLFAVIQDQFFVRSRSEKKKDEG